MLPIFPSALPDGGCSSLFIIHPWPWDFTQPKDLHIVSLECTHQRLCPPLTQLLRFPHPALMTLFLSRYLDIYYINCSLRFLFCYLHVRVTVHPEIKSSLMQTREMFSAYNKIRSVPMLLKSGRLSGHELSEEKIPGVFTYFRLQMCLKTQKLR